MRRFLRRLKCPDGYRVNYLAYLNFASTGNQAFKEQQTVILCKRIRIHLVLTNYKRLCYINDFVVLPGAGGNTCWSLGSPLPSLYVTFHLSVCI